LDQQDAFQSYIEGGLENFGIEADETERAVMSGVFRIWQPALIGLLNADLDDVVAEPVPDLSAPPRP
jgi:hypothetical protein